MSTNATQLACIVTSLVAFFLGHYDSAHAYIAASLVIGALKDGSA